MSEWNIPDMGPPIKSADTPRYRSGLAESYLAAESKMTILARFGITVHWSRINLHPLSACLSSITWGHLGSCTVLTRYLSCAWPLIDF